VVSILMMYFEEMGNAKEKEGGILDRVNGNMW
jgi:hypothetical protein